MVKLKLVSHEGAKTRRREDGWAFEGTDFLRGLALGKTPPRGEVARRAEGAGILNGKWEMGFDVVFILLGRRGFFRFDREL
jgi:hypothetical protein